MRQAAEERRTEEAWRRGGALKAFTTTESGRENDNARTRHFSNENFFTHVQFSRTLPRSSREADASWINTKTKDHIVRADCQAFFLASNERSVPFWPENAARISHQVLIFP